MTSAIMSWPTECQTSLVPQRKNRQVEKTLVHIAKIRLERLSDQTPRKQDLRQSGIGKDRRDTDLWRAQKENERVSF